MAAVDIETEQQKRQRLATLATLMGPEVRGEYNADPRTGVARGLIAQGSNFAPVQGGIWEGLARVGAGLAGGYIGKQQMKKYGAASDVLENEIQASLRKQRGLGADSVNPATITGVQGYAPTQPNLPVSGDINNLQAFNPPAPQGPAAVANALTSPVPTGPMSGAPPGNFTRPPVQPGGASLPQLPGTTPQPARAAAVPTSPVAGAPGRGQAVTDFDKFDSPAYEPIEAAMERKYNLPTGTLKGLRMAERSNANQVSETGARTVYQFIPGTRRAFMRKHGVDAWAGPRQAVEAAALHIRGSLDRGKDINGALRDYRGVDESADPGWYARARGGTGGEGAGGTVSAVGQPAPPAQVAVPDLPTAPTAPERPAMRERIKSARMQIVDSLLQGDDSLSPTLRSFGINRFLNEGLNEEQKSKEAEYEAQSQLDNIQYQSQLTGYNQQTANVQEAQIADHAAAVAQNYQQINDAFRESNSNFRNSQDNIAAMQRQEAGDKAAGERAKITDNNPAVWAQKEIFKANNQIQDADNALGLLSQIPDAVGLKYSIGDIASQRLDPNGEKVRAAVANFAGLLLHGISGAAVTPEEYERNRAWLPSPNDTADAVRTKINFIKSQSQRSLGTLNTMGIATPGAGMAAAAPAALPAGVTVTERK